MERNMYSENSFSESLSTHLFPDGLSAKVKITFLRSEKISTKVWFKFKLKMQASLSPDWFMRGSKLKLQALI